VDPGNRLTTFWRILCPFLEATDGMVEYDDSVPARDTFEIPFASMQINSKGSFAKGQFKAYPLYALGIIQPADPLFVHKLLFDAFTCLDNLPASSVQAELVFPSSHIMDRHRVPRLDHIGCRAITWVDRIVKWRPVARRVDG
jgi:hypothetical protein